MGILVLWYRKLSITVWFSCLFFSFFILYIVYTLSVYFVYIKVYKNTNIYAVLIEIWLEFRTFVVNEGGF